jgi:hypothetical protein
MPTGKKQHFWLLFVALKMYWIMGKNAVHHIFQSSGIIQRTENGIFLSSE